MDDGFTFSAKKQRWCIIIDQIFSGARADQWPIFQLTTNLTI